MSLFLNLPGSASTINSPKPLVVSPWRVSVTTRATVSVPGRRHYNNTGRGPAVWVQLCCLPREDHIRIPHWWLWGQSVSTALGTWQTSKRLYQTGGTPWKLSTHLAVSPLRTCLLPNWPWSCLCSRGGGIRNISESCREAEVIQCLTCIIGLGSERVALEGWAWSGAGITNSLFPCLESSPTNTFIAAFRRKTKAIQGIWCEDVRLSSLFTSL